MLLGLSVSELKERKNEHEISFYAGKKDKEALEKSKKNGSNKNNAKSSLSRSIMRRKTND